MCISNILGIYCIQMAKLEYGDYSFFDKPIDDKKKPIIEGIANFCALNRSQNSLNENKKIWDNLANSLTNYNNQQIKIDDSNSTNSLLKLNMGKIGDIVQSNGKNATFGSVYVFTKNFDNYIDKIPVTEKGIFDIIGNIIQKSPESYSFAYEDVDGRMRRVVINKDTDTLQEGFLSLNKIFGLVITDEDISGLLSYSYTRDANGNLQNTEKRNSGAEERYNNMKSIYTETIANTTNLGLGIILAILFITTA